MRNNSLPQSQKSASDVKSNNSLIAANNLIDQHNDYIDGIDGPDASLYSKNIDDSLEIIDPVKRAPIIRKALIKTGSVDNQ